MLRIPVTPRSALEAQLPENPSHGDTFTLPPGVTSGGVSSLALKHRTEIIGYALNYAPVAGVPDLLKLNWVTTNFPIEEKLVLELVSTQYTYTALRYDRILGWLGYGEVLPVGSYSLYVRVYNVMSPPSNAEIKSYETVYVKRMPQEA